jgi:phosphoenolpyruvate---glycerone phosphotransferase subunit DhaL
MKKTIIGPKDLREVLQFVSEVIANEEGRLNALDAAIGDGDHGITVRIGFQAIRKSVEDLPNGTDIPAILGHAGRSFMDATGGAIGVILGRMLSCGEKALKGHETFGVDELMCWLEAMESTITAVGNAKPGDKTILDAVHAAKVAVSASVSQGRNDLVETLLAASRAADAAARDTANMLCKVGRASRLGERVLGHPDPGAVTFSMILDSFYRWLREHSQEGSAARSSDSQV